MLSTRKARAGAAVLAASVVAGGIALGVGPASAAPSSKFTITSLSTHLVPATTLNQVLTVTGTGFSEDVISGVSIYKTDGTTKACTTDPMYIVTSATSLVLKTPADCAVGVNNIITITDDTTTDTVSSTPTSPTATIAAAQKLDFVAPPTLGAVPTDLTTGTYPVVSVNTALQKPINQVVTAPVTGGTTIRVTAGSTLFATSTTLPLAASLGGVALTNLVAHYSSGNTGPIDSFTAKTGAHAAGPVSLAVTSGGVTKSFSNALTNFTYAGTAITVAPAFGPTDGGNVIKIAGAGFVPSGTGASTVKVCGVSTTVLTSTGNTPSATSLSVTAPAFSDPTATTATTAIDGTCTVQVTTGSTISIINAGSTYTYVAQG